MAQPTTTIWNLPPLILHPFSDQGASARLVENTRTALMMCGMLPGDGSPQEELARKLLEGRYAEIRMLFFLGRDLARWLEQCVEFAQRTPELAGDRLREQSFAVLLIQNPPPAVALKLQGWGVADSSMIFSRAIALNHLFREAPEFGHLAEDFIRNYHRYADFVFACWRQLTPFHEISCENFHFELYASGEYTKMLETQWGGE